MSKEPRDVKIVVLGASNTGRRALIRKYVHSAFSERYESFDDAAARKQITVDGESYLVELSFADLKSHTKIELGDAFVLLYAINDRGSFIGTRDLCQVLQQTRVKSAGIQSNITTSSTSVPIYLVGSKIDLESERQVSLEEAKTLAIELRCRKLFEISSKIHNAEIDDLFTKLIRELPRSQRQQQQQQQQLQQLSPPPRQRQYQSTSTTTSAYMAQQELTRPGTMSSQAPAGSLTSPDTSPRRGSMLDRFKFGSLRRTPSTQSMARKKSDSFGETMKKFNSPSSSRDNLRSTSTGRILNGNIGNGAGTRTNWQPFKLDVDTSAWRETVKWPTEIIPEEELKLK